MAFTLADKERIRYFLGFPNVSPMAAIAQGSVIPLQTLFLIDSAMEKMLPEGEDRVRRILGYLDQIECRMVENMEYFVVSKLDGMDLRDGVPDKLEKEYTRWAYRLANQFGVPVYGLSGRFVGMGGVNIPVCG